MIIFDIAFDVYLVHIVQPACIQFFHPLFGLSNLASLCCGIISLHTFLKKIRWDQYSQFVAPSINCGSFASLWTFFVFSSDYLTANLLLNCLQH